MKKRFALTSLILTLTACGTPSVEDLIDDPELLAEVVQECTMKMAQGKSIETEACQNAGAAQKQMAENMINGLMSQLGNN